MVVDAAAGTIVGREAELVAVNRFLDSVPRGSTALLLEGEAGVGKTTLWSSALALAAERSMRTLSARAAEAEVTLPFAALLDVLDPVLDETIDQLPEPQRAALDAALLRASPTAEAPSILAVATATLNTLRIVAAERATVIGLDDIQWLDPASERVLGFAFRRLGDQPIGVVATRRAAASADGGGGLALETTRVRVHPLSAEPLAVVLERELAVRLPRTRLRELHRLTGGNPLYALEVAREAAASGAIAEDGELPIPPSLRDMLCERVRSLEPRTRRLLLVLAQVREPSLATLDAIEADAGALHEAFARRLLERDGNRVRFTHPLLASAVRTDALPGEVRAAHRFLASRVEDDVARALHLALAATDPDEAVAETLDAAAATAQRRGAPEVAAVVAEHAVRLTPANGEARWRRVLQCARFFFRAADIERSRELLEELLATIADGPLKGHTLVWLSYVRQDEPIAAALCASALAQPGISARERADFSLRKAYLEGFAADLDAAQRSWRSAAAAARDCEDPWLLACAIAGEALISRQRGRRPDRAKLDWAVQVQDRHRKVGDAPEYYVEPRFTRARVAIREGDLRGAREDLEHELAHARALGDEIMQTRYHWDLARVDLLEGRFAASLVHANTGLELAEHVEMGWFRAGMCFACAMAHACLGDLDRARGHVERGFERAEGLEPRLNLKAALGFIELTAGNAAAADACLSEAVAANRAAGFQDAPPFALDLVEAKVALGLLDEAEELIEWLESLARPLDYSFMLAGAARSRALVVAGRGDVEHALAHAESSVRSYERLPFPFEHARGLLVHGSVLRRAKRRRAAAEALEDARRMFDEMGASVWVERASAELHRTGLRRGARWELTPTEARIAHLAASGARNKAIARQLFVSEKTVEANLSRAYRKLDVTSRTELAARLGTGEDPVTAAGEERR